MSTHAGEAASLAVLAGVTDRSCGDLLVEHFGRCRARIRDERGGVPAPGECFRLGPIGQRPGAAAEPRTEAARREGATIQCRPRQLDGGGDLIAEEFFRVLLRLGRQRAHGGAVSSCEGSDGVRDACVLAYEVIESALERV